jgi:hypothetical protein
MHFKCVTYTSLAALDLDEDQLRSIHGSAVALNGIDGISGLLLFNGTHFLQWIEGPPTAIDELIERLRRDPRHSGFEIRDERMSDERLFGDWSMRLVRVRSTFLLAQDDVAPQLPETLPDQIRMRIMRMVERISDDVEL